MSLCIFRPLNAVPPYNVGSLGVWLLVASLASLVAVVTLVLVAACALRKTRSVPRMEMEQTDNSQHANNGARDAEDMQIFAHTGKI